MEQHRMRGDIGEQDFQVSEIYVLFSADASDSRRAQPDSMGGYRGPAE